MIFTDKRTGIDKDQLKNAAKPLEDKGVVIVSVAIGNEADAQELGQVTEDPDNVVTSPKTVKPSALGETIMEKALKGTQET